MQDRFHLGVALVALIIRLFLGGLCTCKNAVRTQSIMGKSNASPNLSQGKIVTAYNRTEPRFKILDYSFHFSF